MTVLSNLPDETLERILEYVTSNRESLENVSLVNSRFNKIVFPLLVRQWNNSQECLEPSIERLALHLLRNPDLRRHVERLDLGYLRPLHDHDPDSADLSPESLAALADAAEKDLNVSKFLSTHLPLGQVRHVTLQPWNSEEVFDMAYARSFLHFPCIQTLCAYGLFDDLDNGSESDDNELPLTHLVDYVLPFPVSTSPITELTIVGCLRSGVPDFITACRSLRKLNVRVDFGLGIYGMPDQKELAEAVIKHKDSLEDLDLDISIMNFPNPDPVLEETYSQLSRIRTLAVHIAEFFKGAWSKGVEDCIKVVLDRIPQDIQVLKPRSHRFIESWVSLARSTNSAPRVRRVAIQFVPNAYFKELRKPGSLSAPGIILGDTITDAMKFCRQIDLRFLWVDQLCIPQRPGSVDPEIHHMASIYSGATCTLVALSGTTFADPLPGVRPGTRHPESQHQAIADGLRLMICYPSLFTEIESSVWFSRGWTFQEVAFRNESFSSRHHRPSSCVVRRCTARKVSGKYQMRGVITGVSKSTPSGPWVIPRISLMRGLPGDRACSFGLPLDQFGFGLGWQPLHGHSPDPVNQRAGFPSWSWSSFQGTDGYSIGSLQCDSGWRDKQPDRLEFIVFATAKLTDPQPPQCSGYPAGCGTSRYNAKMSGRLFSDQYSYEAAVSRWQDLCSKERFVLDLMCISRGSDGLARRVQVCHGISLDQWLTLEPKEVFVRLG
ncbi:heterokaryon incompatibility protein-domain-containing protein [Fusarium oxysporum]|nr:heterokaryon incompatibility protein-domain-containing protein [Fusarium oxysporum]